MAYKIDGGKKADILYAYDRQPIVFVNLTQHMSLETYNDPNHYIYDILEAFKDGCFLSTKYESRMVVFEPVHLIVFANKKPCPDSSISLDRWNIKRIGIDF